MILKILAVVVLGFALSGIWFGSNFVFQGLNNSLTFVSKLQEKGIRVREGTNRNGRWIVKL